MAGTITRVRRRSVGGCPIRSGSRGILALAGAFVVALLHPAAGQEIPRPSVTRQKAKTAVPTVSNFRVGEVLMRVDATVTTDFTDNVSLQPNGRSDIIVTPQVGITTTWAVTKRNTIRFRTSFGYAYYFNNPNLNNSQFVIAPDSALSFDVYTGDFRINFHDQFSLQQDPTGAGGVNGVAQLGRFTNTIGVSVLWDTNDVIWSFGYDHYNLITTNATSSSSGQNVSTYSNLDHSTEQVSASASFRLSSALISGIEATGSSSDYPDQPSSNFTSYTVGAFVELQLTRYTHLLLSGGYKGYSPENTASGTTVSNSTTFPQKQGDSTGYYASLSLVHRLNRFYSDNLSLGHSDDVDGFNGRSVSDFVRYTATWRMNEKISLGAGLFLENVDASSVVTALGTTQQNYTRFGASLSTGYQLTEHTGLSLGYQYINKQAAVESQNYVQNRVTISIGYRF